jgi:transposase
LDESGIKLGQTSDYARAEGGARVVVPEPKHLGKNITLIAAMSIVGVISAMYCTCTLGGDGFLAFVENFLLPELQPGQILIMDNVSFHKIESIIEVIKSAGVRVVHLPQYSPELNPIENMWSKLKAYLKKKKVKTLDQLSENLKHGLNEITEYDCQSWFNHSGYVL